jgi:hypothetical protein
VTSATLPASALSLVVFTVAFSLWFPGDMDREESAAAHRQVLRPRCDVTRAASEDSTAAWPNRRSWLSRFARNANGPTARSPGIIRSSVLKVN